MIELLAIAGLVLACGTNSSPKTDSPESYADAVCRAWFSHGDELRRSIELVGAVDPGQPEALRQYASEMASLESGLSEDLASIEAPDEIAGLHSQIVDAHRRAAEAWTDVEQTLDRTAGQAGDGSSASLEDALDATTRARESEPTLPDSYQQAIQANERCKKLEEALYGSDG